MRFDPPYNGRIVAALCRADLISIQKLRTYDRAADDHAGENYGYCIAHGHDSFLPVPTDIPRMNQRNVASTVQNEV